MCSSSACGLKRSFRGVSREAGAVDPSHTGLLFRCDCLGFEHASLREPFVAADVGRSMTGSARSGCSTARWCTRGAPVRLRTRSAREGTQVHSADLDDALCTSGALASSGAGGETLLPFAVDDARLRGATRRAVRGACCGCHRKCPLFVRPAPALTIRACLCSQAVARQGAAAVSSMAVLVASMGSRGRSLTASSRVRCGPKRRRSATCTRPSGACLLPRQRQRKDDPPRSCSATRPCPSKTSACRRGHGGTNLNLTLSQGL